MERLRKLLHFAFENFGPMLVFFFMQRLYGFRVAILSSLAFVAVEVLLLLKTKRKPTHLFVLTTSMTLVFGFLDLLTTSPIFFKFEAPFINLILAVAFALTLFQERSLIEQVAESRGHGPRSEQPREDVRYFFQILTACWALYFLIKASAFVWINLNNSFEQGFWLRLAIGNVSFVGMMFFSIFLSRKFWKVLRAMRVFPSQRATAIRNPC